MAIELVLAHDFDEPSPAAATPSAQEAQSVREQILIDLAGIGPGGDAGTTSRSVDSAAHQSPLRARSAPLERRATRPRAGARRR